MTEEGVTTRCPHCGVNATGYSEIDTVFGFRKIRPGHIIPQSYCRKCRIKQR